LDSLEPEPVKPDWEGQAREAWLVVHQTEEEQLEVARCLRRWKDAETRKPTEAELDGYEALFSAAKERAAKEDDADWREFAEKWIRVETLRRSQRRLTDTEGDELMDLNSWLQGRSCFHPETGKLGSL
jgi:hypothetical protein